MPARKYNFDAFWDNLPDILTPVNVLNLLHLSETNVNKKLNSGEIPGFKIGDLWRISRQELQADIESRMNDEERLKYLLAETERIKKKLDKKITRIA